MAQDEQPPTTDELPCPGPADTVRALRDGVRIVAPGWRRWLPSGLASLTFHGVALALALIVTVRFADRLFVPTTPSWHNSRDTLGTDRHNYLMFYPDRDLDRADEITVAAGNNERAQPAAAQPEPKPLTDKPGGASSDWLRWDDRLKKALQDAQIATVAARTKPSSGRRVVHQPADSIPGDDAAFKFNYVPTPAKVVREMLRLADVQPGDLVFDLGCGDGRVLTAAVKHFGALGFGYDVDQDRVARAQKAVEANNLQEQITIEYRDLFKLDLAEADVVTLYLFPVTNLRLIPQLEKLKPGARIVSHDFDLGDDIVPDKVVDIDAVDDWGNTRTHRIYLWTTPLRKK